ncbi:RDD family protein [Nocardioides sp. R-C-SC26]|uniref:RDD family protein n=1 Tax=Nocardioides sp. R-C-SC26 TaxID=2870414 RepID=UPI001E4359B9|nr:RDD family protein [Nocardioides sp. R-C-SC26]
MTESYPPPPPPPAPGLPRPAELLDRFLARLIDGLILAVPFFVISTIGNVLFLHGFRYSTGEWFLYWIFVSAVNVGLTIGYFAYLESSQGATIGKKALKLQVTRADGDGLITAEQSVKRNCFYLIQLAFIVPFVGTFLGGLAQLAAVIMIAVTISNDTVGRRGWHDQLADTRVLKVG